MTLRVLIPLVEGFEEIEAVTPIDILRRAGIEVVVAGVAARRVTGGRGIVVETDVLLGELPDVLFDALILPGGPGTRRLRESADVMAILRAHAAAGRLVAAICAAPTVLATAGLLEGRRATCYPACEGDMRGAVVVREEVVVDGRIITSRGAGTALPFALAVVGALMSQEKAREIADSIVYQISQ